MGCSYLMSSSGWLFGYHKSPASLLYECLSMLIFLFCTDTVWSLWSRVCGRASEVCRNPDPFVSYLNREICMYAWTRTWIKRITTIWLTQDNAIVEHSSQTVCRLLQGQEIVCYRITVAWCFEPALGSIVDSGCSLDMISVHTHNYRVEYPN